ncbi:MAG: efflux RND transporter periplasmic adaptor subunit [Candidatus Competibacteraceae bacterium]|nr:efflux RND transporter periplasmic adaptor subunit [Candidatus Competibacteraceae bacterium]
MALSKTSLILTGLILAAGAAAFSYWPGSKTQPQPRYRSQIVDRGDIVQTITANGTLNPVVLVNVGTQVSGTVRKIHADFNDRVKEDQVLAELDPALFQAQVNQSEANVLSAQAALQLAQIKIDRIILLQRKNLVSKEELDIARQQVDAATAQVKLAEAQRERDRINLRNSVIRSPISGVVVARSVDVGQTVAANFQTPTLFQIAQDLRKMQINTSIAEADVGSLQPEMAATFTVDAYPDQRFQGRIRQVRLNPTIQQNVVTYNVVVDVDNADGRLMPGMTAYVSVNAAGRKNVLRAPNAALSFQPRRSDDESSGSRPPAKDRKTQVHVLDERGQLKPVPVETGLTDNTLTEIISGDLKPGDRVVTRETGSKRDAGAGSSNFRFRM